MRVSFAVKSALSLHFQALILFSLHTTTAFLTPSGSVSVSVSVSLAFTPKIAHYKTQRNMSSSSSTVNMSSKDTNFQSPAPKLPLPSPLLSLTPGTWAHDTMSRRIDSEILERTFQENKDEFLNDAKFAKAYENFKLLRKDLQNASSTPLRHLHPLTEHMKNDPVIVQEYEEWYNILKPFVDKEEPDTWLSAPWMVAEFYLYRRLMEAIEYFDPQSSTFHYDPFAKQKSAGLHSSVTTADPILKQIEGLSTKSVEDSFGLAAAFALWGNKMDLSIWPTEENSNIPGVFQQILASANDNLLHDDTNELVRHGQNLLAKGGGNVDIVVDNAGFELIMDLALADYLIASGIASKVTFQLKSHPTFVSDALEKDLRQHVEYYAKQVDPSEYPSAKAAGERWEQYLSEGKWICNEDSFWVQPPPMWQMPETLRGDLKSRCDLAFIKGDANYRRLLGDLEWDFSAPFEDVVGNYFPCPVCALRTLKAEVGCGMEKEKVNNAKTLDDQWLVNGRFGVVHFSNGASN
jgi:hypothetical protein